MQFIDLRMIIAIAYCDRCVNGATVRASGPIPHTSSLCGIAGTARPILAPVSLESVRGTPPRPPTPHSTLGFNPIQRSTFRNICDTAHRDRVFPLLARVLFRPPRLTHNTHTHNCALSHTRMKWSSPGHRQRGTRYAHCFCCQNSSVY